MTEPQRQLALAAQQAWVGLWRSCMADVGAKSLLPYDESCVVQALNGTPPEPLSEVVDRGYVDPAPLVLKAKSDWAQILEGDERISAITLGDVLTGLDDYFNIFRQIKKTQPSAYAYFSRVGAPLCFENTRVWKGLFLHPMPPPIIDPASLPAYLGLFLARSRDEARRIILKDEPAFLDFHLYEKRRKNMVSVAPPSWTLIDHTELSLDRDVFSKRERKQFPEAGRFGFHYYIGIDPQGHVHAMPMQMTRSQALKNGGVIHHSKFAIPPGLKEWAGKNGTVDGLVATYFAIVRGFAAAALSGVQLSVRRGNETARFGIPLAYVRSFFRDREREGARRKSLLHLVAGHSYERAGKTIIVGEHLRGARRFSWRGHDIVLSAPGIHHAAPEALTAEVLADDDLAPIPKDVVSIGELGRRVRKDINRLQHVPIRRGQPTKTYRTAVLSVNDGRQHDESRASTP